MFISIYLGLTLLGWMSCHDRSGTLCVGAVGRVAAVYYARGAGGGSSGKLLSHGHD